MFGLGTILSSVGSTIASALSSAASFIGGVIGPGLSKLSNILEITEKVMEIIEGVSNIVETIGKILGLIDKEETAQELGAKALESDKKADDFDSVEDYICYLRNEVSLDMQKFETMNDTDKLTCASVGSVILAKGISEKKEIEVDIDFLVDVANLKMQAKEVEAYIDNFKEKDLELNLGDYLRGELPIPENLKIKPVIKETLSQLNPDLSESQIDDKIFEMRQTLSNKHEV